MRFIGSLLTKVYFTEAIPNSVDPESDIATNHSSEDLANKRAWVAIVGL